MIQANTAEQSAKRLLRVFLDQGLRAENVLSADSFVAPFSKPGWTLADLESGLEFAIDEDWIEQVSLEAYRLTAEGFGAA